jgi:hypothetical protein
MVNYQPPIKRRNHGKGHSYTDANGIKVPGVTTIINGGVPKHLEKWAAEQTANYAVDNWDELAGVKPSTRLSRMMKARFDDRDTAAARGTKVHSLAEKLIRGEKVSVPDELRGHVESCVRFMNEWDVEPVLTEFTAISYTHGYAGTGDLVADLAHEVYLDRTERWILDYKTSRSGVFGETALQLAGYRYADAWADADGVETEPLEVDRAGVVHIRADGYSLVPVEAGPLQHRQLLYAQQVKLFADDSRELVGTALEPPNREEADAS